MKVRQPDPISEGWEAYKDLVHTHLMTGGGRAKCLNHKDCHLDSFYPGKLYRAIKMKRNEDGILTIDKE